MFALVRQENENPVFAVRHGYWKHISGPQLYALRKAGLVLNNGEIRVLTADEITELYNLLDVQ